jgi:hypothetical protein
LVPLLPIVSSAFCLVLMMGLPLLTCIRFFVWLIFGLFIYFLKFTKHREDEPSTKRGSCQETHPRHAYVAFIDGIATLADAFPEPRERTIRAIKHQLPQWASVESAVAHDWAAVGQDLWSAIKAHKHEATEETAVTTTEHASTS